MFNRIAPICLFLLTSLPALAQFSSSDLQKAAGGFLEQKAAESNVPPAVIDGVKQLASTFGFNQLDLAKLAQQGLTALNKGEDVAALGAFDRLGAAKLSPDQLTAFRDVKTLVDVYVLQQNFSATPEVASPLGKALMAVKSGDYPNALGQLQAISKSISPTADQKALLTSLTEQYQGWAKAAAEKDEAAKKAK